VPVAGTYNFTLTSTDGSRVTLTPAPGDDIVLINNDGPYSPVNQNLCPDTPAAAFSSCLEHMGPSPVSQAVCRLLTTVSCRVYMGACMLPGSVQ